MNKKSIKNLWVHIPLIILMLCCVLPFLLVLAISFSDEAMISNYGYSLIPQKFSLEAYKYVFEYPQQILRSYGVTITVTTIGTVLGVLLTAGLAYPIARPDYKLKRPLSLYIFITMVFNGGLVPTYILISQYLHLKDTLAVLILPLMVSAWNVFLLKTFFMTIPISLIESAKLDGASEFKILFQIVLPLAKVGIAVVTLFIMLTYWNDWFLSLIYIDNDKIVSLQYLLYRIMESVTFFTQSSGAAKTMMGSMTLPDETVRMAICVIAAGPMVLVFPFFQKYFVKGITIGSVKG